MSAHSSLRRSPGWVAVIAVLILVVAFSVIREGRDGDASRNPARDGGASPRPVVTASADLPAGEDDGGLSWTSAGGVALPVSPEHGPIYTTDGSVSGFARTEVGAAIAAVHLVVMTSPTAGPASFGPTIDKQVVGPNAPVMAAQVAEQYQALRLPAGVEDGQPPPGANADVVGFLLDAYDPAHAVVRLVLTSPELRADDRVIELPVTLAWTEGDWALVAPPNGVWDSLVQVATAPPEGLQRFEAVA